MAGGAGSRFSNVSAIPRIPTAPTHIPWVIRHNGYVPDVVAGFFRCGLGRVPGQDLSIGVLGCGGKISCRNRKRTKLSERSATPADDPFRGRQPTSHERMTGLPWDASYHNGPVPWDIGQPQPVIVRLASEGKFTGAVLDAGCGTGENALYVASLGLTVLGIDVAETALMIARQKAHDRRIDDGAPAWFATIKRI